MKRLKYLFLTLIVIVGISSCQKKITTGDVTTNTVYLPIITLAGESTMILNVGDTYDEPGATATAGGETIDVTITGTVNTAVAGKYVLNYSATSPDGYDNSFDRVVWVVPPRGDFSSSLAGYYTSTVLRDGAPAFEDLEYVIIEETGNPNEYSITDAVGGYYAIGRNYGPNYAFSGGSFTYDFGTSAFAAVTDGIAPGWGNHVTLADMVVDANAKTISFNGNADFGSVFGVTLTQQ